MLEAGNAKGRETVPLSSCPMAVRTWHGSVEQQAFKDGSSPVVQDLYDLLLTAQQSSFLSGGLSGSLSLINECLCP